MDIQPYIDRIMETENLTGELEDSEANQLLEWGVRRLKDLLESVDDRRTAGERTNALMAVIRKINRIAGSSTKKDLPVLVEDLRELRQLFVQANGYVQTFPVPDLEAIAGQLQQISTREVIDFLINWY